MTPIKNLEYGKIVSKKGMKGSGLSVGQTVLIISTKAFPEKRSDPYLHRVYAVAVVVGDNGHEIPKEDNEYKSYLIDPRCLERLPDEEQEVLREALDKEYNNVDS